MGIKPVRNTFQIDSIDPPLRMSLWNELTNAYWSIFKKSNSSKVSTVLREHTAIYDLFMKLWQYYFMIVK